MELFLYPMMLLAFRPVPVFAVFIVMVLPSLLPWYGRRAKVAMLCFALPWLLFTYTEATIPTSANIRVDLAILGPVYLLCFIAWILTLVLFRRRTR